MTQRFDEQPDVGGNRHYDYISIAEHEAAEKSLEEKEHWRDLNTHEIVVLRDQAKARGFQKDVIDYVDRLDLIRCLLVTAKNRDEWRDRFLKTESNEVLKRKMASLEAECVRLESEKLTLLKQRDHHNEMATKYFNSMQDAHKALTIAEMDLSDLRFEAVRLVAALKKIEGVNRSINTHYQWIASEALAACPLSIELTKERK